MNFCGDVYKRKRVSTDVESSNSAAIGIRGSWWTYTEQKSIYE